MNQSTPSPDPAGSQAELSHTGKRSVLRTYWWLPLLTTFLGLVLAAAFSLLRSPTYVSSAELVESPALRFADVQEFLPDSRNSSSSQVQVMRSEAMAESALKRLQSAEPKPVLPRGQDGEPLPVAIRVRQSPSSAVCVIEASTSDAAYAQTYLDALVGAYLDWRRNLHKVVSGDTLASISEQVLRAERDLRVEQDILKAFEQTNNLMVLRAQEAVTVENLKRLNAQLLALQIENTLDQSRTPIAAGDSTPVTNTAQVSFILKSIKEWEGKLVAISGATLEAERLKQNIERARGLYERLSALIQNVAVQRNISQQTLAVLNSASPAKRAYFHEMKMLAGGVGGGLLVGFGILGILGVWRGSSGLRQ